MLLPVFQGHSISLKQVTRRVVLAAVVFATPWCLAAFSVELRGNPAASQGFVIATDFEKVPGSAREHRSAMMPKSALSVPEPTLPDNGTGSTSTGTGTGGGTTPNQLSPRVSFSPTGGGGPNGNLSAKNHPGSGESPAVQKVLGLDGAAIWFGRFGDRVTYGELAAKSRGGGDGFLAKADVDGNPLWLFDFGGLGGDSLDRIVLLADETILIAGRFSDLAEFGPFQLQSLGETDLFLAKVDRLGAVVWVRRIGGSGPDTIRSLHIDADGTISLEGTLYYSAVFEGDLPLEHGESRRFVIQYGPEGQLNWLEMED